MSETTLILNARVYLPDALLEPGWVLIAGRRIAQIGVGEPSVGIQSARMIDAGRKHLLPGFIDLHVHGSNGYEVMDADPGSIFGMARFQVTHGVTGFLATTLSAPHERIMDAIRAVEHANAQPLKGGLLSWVYTWKVHILIQNVAVPRIPGRSVAPTSRNLLTTSAGGMIRLIAVAPEFPENLWLIEACKKRKITVSAGHTSANLDQMRHAISLGLSQVTHIYNAMGPSEPPCSGDGRGSPGTG